jgi:O-antigen/teichoic acid export membrane protein
MCSARHAYRVGNCTANVTSRSCEKLAGYLVLPRVTMRSLIEFARQQGADRQIRSNVLLLGVVLIGAVLAFAMFAVIARDIGPERFGHFAAIFNAVSFLAVVAALGQETLIGRSWNEYAGRERYDLAGGALVFGIRNVLIGALLAAVLVVVIGPSFGLTSKLALAAAALVVFQTLLAFSTSASRPLAGVFAATSGFEVTWRLVTIIGVLAAIALAHEISDEALLLLLAGGTALAVTMQSVLSYRQLPKGIDWSGLAFEPKPWFKRCVPMWGAAILEATNQYVDVVLIALLIDPVAAGGYFAANRISNAFAKVTLATSNLAASRVSLLYFNRPRAELLSFIRSLALSTAGLVCAGLAAIFVLGTSLLSIFGATYADEFWTLMVLSIGTATVALCGPTPYMLLHTGHETAYTRTIAAALAARLALFFVLTPLLGTLGAALAFTLVSIGSCIVLNVVCRRRLGIDPSVGCLITPTNLEQAERA